jgi:hypothetical protein
MRTDEIKLLSAAEFIEAVGWTDEQLKDSLQNGRIRFLVGADGTKRIPETEVKRMKGELPVPIDRSQDLRLTVVPMEVHLESIALLKLERKERRAAQKRSRKLERELIAAQVQLSGAQKSLAESAESLKDRQQVDQEKGELSERLRQLEERMARLPGWVRRLFGA